MEWLTIEVFDADAAAWGWRDRHGQDLVSLALSTAATYWEWHEHRYGVALEVSFRNEDACELFRRLPAVRAALELAPDPVSGVLVYRGRGGGAGSAAHLGPRPFRGEGALALPIPVDEPREPCVGRVLQAS